MFEVVEYIIDAKAVGEKLCEMLKLEGIVLASTRPHSYEVFSRGKVAEVEDKGRIRKGHSY